jgi:hypothetical protein
MNKEDSAGVGGRVLNKEDSAEVGGRVLACSCTGCEDSSMISGIHVDCRRLWLSVSTRSCGMWNKPYGSDSNSL